MLWKLERQNLVRENDGIVSQASHQEWNPFSSLEKPMLNDGAIFGIGRGRYIETKLPRHLQQGAGVGLRPKSPVFQQQRIDRESRPMRDKPVIIPQDFDERYLPKQTNAQKRGRRNSRSSSPSLLRASSPSLLKDGRPLEQPVALPSSSRAAQTAGRKSPVIVNLPPVSGTSRSAKRCNVDVGGSTTGSSNDFPSSPTPKKRKRQEAQCDSDDEVMIITDNNKNGTDVIFLFIS